MMEPAVKLGVMWAATIATIVITGYGTMFALEKINQYRTDTEGK
ncbi:hypothetical protein [Natrinema sp. DC36]|nr:hypothetical protein [Natrinema sp. DC36]